MSKQIKPIHFPEATANLAKPDNMTDDECGSLWVHQSTENVCISCWRIPFWVRVKMLFHGRVWLGVYSGKTQPPVWLDGRKQIFEQKPKNFTGNE